MNGIGLMLVELAARGLAFAVVGSLLFLAIRRRTPAAGASAALATLSGLVIVALLTFGPWPRWWSLDAGGAPPRPVGVPEAAVEAVETAPLAAPPAAARPSLDVFWSALADEMRKAPAAPAIDRAAAGWRWPAWLAAGILGVTALGLARVGLGLLAVGRLRRRCRSLEDPALLEQIDVLRAELSCTRRVEVLACDDLATPATIGWRRPAILLPPDRDEWTADERRAVLAHELAHVRRGDYLAGLWAQVCLALNWFNPLAHWLLARLRLQQELAADAWAARLSGGQRAYLMALAHLALRNEQRPVRGPARAFLPSRDTFVRRIQMLRDIPDLKAGPASTPARALTLTTLGAATLLIAGLRGPATLTARAQEAAKAKTVTAPAAAPATAIELLDFVPVETGLMVDLRPADLLKSPEAAEFVAGLGDGGMSPFGELEAATGLKPAEIARVVLAWAGSSAVPAPGGPPFFVILEATRPVDWSAVIRETVPGAISVEFAGKSYWRSPNGPAGEAFFVASDRVVVAGSESAVQSAIAAARRPGHSHNWDEALAKVADGPARIAADAVWVARRLQPMLTGPPGTGLQSFAPLWSKAISHAASLTDAPGLTLDGAVVCDEPGAEQVADTLRALITLGRNVMQQAVAQPGAIAPPPNQGLTMLAGVVEPLLTSAKVTSEGGVVRLRAETGMSMADVTKALAPALLAARAAAGRAQSVNNLKQIGLAMHNYASTYGKFPPAVLMGPDGKTPHSWRVAILPFIEQDSIYRQYNFNEPWDGPNNRKLLDKIPTIYRAPGAGGDPTHASYFAITGPGSGLGGGDTGLANFTDGLSNTILVVEAKRDVPWTFPDDVRIEANVPLPKLGGYFIDGFDALFADGSVKFIKDSIDEQFLRALFTKSGGEIISSDAY